MCYNFVRQSVFSRQSTLTLTGCQNEQEKEEQQALKSILQNLQNHISKLNSVTQRLDTINLTISGTNPRKIDTETVPHTTPTSNTKIKIVQEQSKSNDTSCRVCKSTKKANKAFNEMFSKMKSPHIVSQQVLATDNSASEKKSIECPVGREDLGVSGWTLLHTISVYFPVQPTGEDKTRMQTFLTLFGQFYPCKECGQEFLEYIHSKPPQLDSREDLMQWMCQAHNDVNERLGKDKFNCSVASLDQRWKSGNSSCNSEIFE